MLHCERRLSEISGTSIYNATPSKELKCNRLVVSISGSSLHHPLCPLHCFILLMNTKWLTQCLRDDGITHVILSIATTLLTGTQYQKAVQSVQIGTHPRSLKLEAIKNVIFIFIFSNPKLVNICYFLSSETFTMLTSVMN